jgi:hypothetical protein
MASQEELQALIAKRQREAAAERAAAAQRQQEERERERRRHTLQMNFDLRVGSAIGTAIARQNHGIQGVGVLSLRGRAAAQYDIVYERKGGAGKRSALLRVAMDEDGNMIAHSELLESTRPPISLAAVDNAALDGLLGDFVFEVLKD